jgi:hypothetical protein
MTLDSKGNVVSQIIQTYAGYRDALPADKRARFDELLNFLYEFIEAINAKDEPFAEETALVTLVLKQHLIIDDLKTQAEDLRKKIGR